MNHLSVQGISLASLRVENFDIFLDVSDRFLISINPCMPADAGYSNDRESEDNANRSWDVFNTLCQKVLRSANRMLHNKDIKRNPITLDLMRRSTDPQRSLDPPSMQSFESSSSHDRSEGKPPIPPRREYVWRNIDRGQQSLATVASQIALDLDIKLTSVNKLTWTDGRSPHRCAGYVREEITLATTIGDSAVVSHDAPSPLEICSVCHEVVGVHEQFQCICNDLEPGSRPTVKCKECRMWSHSECVGKSKEFTCQFCIIGDQPEMQPLFTAPQRLSEPFDEEDDEEPLPPNATDQEILDYKRRQNTLAARRSRRRKLMYQQQLEETVERLTREKEIWKLRALDLSQQRPQPDEPMRQEEHAPEWLLEHHAAPSFPAPKRKPDPSRLSGPRPVDSENPEETFPFRSPTLPPLIFNQPSRCLDIDSAPPSPSPSPTFAHNLPAQSFASSFLNLPPPFTLQPQPQWNTDSPHSTPDSAYSFPPLSFRPMPVPKEFSPDDDRDMSHLIPAQPTRAGRYDPTRGIFVPYSPGPDSSAGPPAA
ncbi:hypothetical protein FB451DRAFT_1365012 [Mycena latifolia]|nr:hypothetical protein FB451DRAFT_1365012 [Mycena latifolia]